MKKLLLWILTVALLTTTAAAGEIPEYSDTEEVDAAVFTEYTVPTLAPADISAPSAILMEKETGTVLFEKNADEPLPPASVTKIMTILLIMEALDAGTLSETDIITTSANAAGMGGSQIYLKENEQMTVRDLLKSIIVASANDAAVAMSEHLAGSEQAFAQQMNRRAKELGMENTTFTNCTGLPEDGQHLTTARDIAIMSRALLQHDAVREYTTIWTDTVRDGTFGLSNTNKLVRFYPGTTGLKTGFTAEAKYCVSATAERDGVEYIAVVMQGETSAARFECAKTMLSYAFSNYTLVTPAPEAPILPIPVSLGRASSVQPVLENATPLLLEKTAASTLTTETVVQSALSAPVQKGDVVGSLTLRSGDTVLQTFPLVAGDTVEKLTLWELFTLILQMFFFQRL